MRRTLVALVAALTLLGADAEGANAFPNGDAPASAMSPIASGVKCTPLQGQLANAAAAAYNSMALAAGEKLATNGCDSAYRPYDRQVFWRGYWCSLGACGNAAVPGTSNHGVGLAADVSTTTRAVMDDIGDRFGWRKTEAFSEWWHMNYAGSFHRPNPGTNLHSPTLRQHSGGPGQNIYVRKIQKLLRGHGDKSVDVDGTYGWQTRVAVRRFQLAERIPTNGIVSPRVWKHLRRPVSHPVHVPPAPAVPAPKPPANPASKPPLAKGPVYGIDISSNNDVSSFDAVRHDGNRFVIAKATEGQDYRNPDFGRDQVRDIVDAGMVPGVYHFLRARLDRTGAREAAWFTEVIGQAGYGKGFLPPVLDVESNDQGLTPAQMCRYVGSFLRLVRVNLGVKPIVYTYPSFGHQWFSGCSWLSTYRLWIAHYGIATPEVPGPWSRYLMWQYTATEHVKGVAGDVDRNVLPGGLAKLRELQIDGLPKRARLAPRAKLTLPLANLTPTPFPPAGAEPIPEIPAPEGALTLPKGTVSAGLLGDLAAALR